MKKMLKSVVNKTIDMCFKNLDGEYENILAKNPELAKESNELSSESEELAAKIENLLPEQYKDLVDKLVNATICMGGIETQMYFKEGVELGATDLSYLGDLGAGLRFI